MKQFYVITNIVIRAFFITFKKEDEKNILIVLGANRNFKKWQTAQKKYNKRCKQTDDHKKIWKKNFTQPKIEKIQHIKDGKTVRHTKKSWKKRKKKKLIKKNN